MGLEVGAQSRVSVELTVAWLHGGLRLLMQRYIDAYTLPWTREHVTRPESTGA